MAIDAVIIAFANKDPKFEELFTAALAEPRSWERFSKPGSDGKTLFGYVNDHMKSSEFTFDTSTVAEPGKSQFQTAYNIYLKTQSLPIRIVAHLLVAGAMPTEQEAKDLMSYDIPPTLPAIEKAAKESPMGTMALLHAYKTNKSDFKELFQHILKYKEDEITSLVLSVISTDGESLYSLAAEANDYALLKILRDLKVEGRLEGVLEPQKLTQLLRKLEPGTLGGLKVYETVSPAYISTIKSGLHMNSDIHPQDDDGMTYLRFTALEDSPAAKGLLLPRTIPRLEVWMQEQTSYLMSSIRIHYIVKAYTYHGDRLVNSLIRRTLTHPQILLESMQQDIKFPLAYQILDSYDALLAKGMVGPSVKDMLLPTGEIKHEAVMKLINDNIAFFNRVNILYPLINAYRKELSKIIKHSPQLGYDMVVFRGVKEESYHAPGTIAYVSNSFLSTSVNPRIARNFGNTPIYGTGFTQFVYEITIPAEIPCLYLEGITAIKGEAEVLLPHNLKIQAKYESNLKHYSFNIEEDSINAFVGDLSGADRIVVRSMKIVGYAPFQEPLTVATQKTVKMSNRKAKAPLLGRNRANNYTRRN